MQRIQKLADRVSLAMLSLKRMRIVDLDVVAGKISSANDEMIRRRTYPAVWCRCL